MKNVLVFTHEEKEKLIAMQNGIHRLSPALLTDGRSFLSSNILEHTESGIYAGKLDGVNYNILPFAEIASLIPQPDPDS
jgi:hypothetical protein